MGISFGRVNTDVVDRQYVFVQNEVTMMGDEKADDGGFQGMIETYRKAAEKRQRNLNKALGDDMSRKKVGDMAPKTKREPEE